MAVGDRVDPYLSFNFLLEIGGVTIGGFTEVSGLQVEIEVSTLAELAEVLAQAPDRILLDNMDVDVEPLLGEVALGVGIEERGEVH